jgi:aldehyde dehydrogenase (NAD+)
MTQIEHRMLIDGELVEATGGRAFDNINPATEETIGVAPNAGPGDVERAIAAARRAFDTTTWSTDTEFRRECLIQLRDGLRKHLETLRPAIVAETGAPIRSTYGPAGIQLEGSVENLAHHIDLLAEYEFERTQPDRTIYGRPTTAVVRREAAGVVAAITPWNFPLYLNLTKTAAALAAGCTVVLKPAPDTPWSATALGGIVAECTDIPPGVFNVVTTTDLATASVLTSHPDVDAVTLTGSTATGRKVMAAAADTVKRVTLELGGKSAAIVLDDANLEAIVGALAPSVCTHAGQGCAINTRLLVPRRRLADAIEVAKAAFERVPWGDPLDPQNMMGPVVNSAQRDKVLHYYELSRRDGRIVVGGNKSDRFERGYFVEPTLVTDIDPSAPVAQDEVFGPLLVVLPFDDDDDAVRIADSTPFGLSGSVFSADTERAMALARRLRTGTVSVNGGIWNSPAFPFGGYKQSGLGREWGVEGLEDFLEVKTIARPAM